MAPVVEVTVCASMTRVRRTSAHARVTARMTWHIAAFLRSTAVVFRLRRNPTHNMYRCQHSSAHPSDVAHGESACARLGLLVADHPVDHGSLRRHVFET